MTWFADNRAWLGRAREQWAPRASAPFRVRVWLSSPIAWSSYGVQLDGFLQRLVVERETGLPADDVFAEIPREVEVDIPIPVTDVMVAGLPIACCSWGMPPRIAIESLRWRRKRARLDAISGARITVAGGPYKSHNIPVATLVTPYLDFHLVGDLERVRDLLGEAHAMARGYASGVGRILGLEYGADPAVRALVWEGQPMRSLPLGEGMPALEDPLVAEVSTRGPYWKGRGVRLCAVPSIQIGPASTCS